MHILRFVSEFVAALIGQLKEDHTRYSDEPWRNPQVNVEQECMTRIYDYLVYSWCNNARVPWLKVAGCAFLSWVRTTLPQSRWGPAAETADD